MGTIPLYNVMLYLIHLKVAL